MVAAFLGSGGTDWSFVTLLAIFGGACVGGSFAPLFSLARDDGDDAAIIRGAHEQGQADTSTEGAQAQDLRRREQ